MAEFSSPFKRNVKSKIFKLVDGYKRDPSFSIRDYVIDVVTSVGKPLYPEYFSGEVYDLWTANIPDKMLYRDDDYKEVPLTEAQLLEFHDHVLSNYMCYLLSIFDIEKTIKEKYDLTNYIRLYLDGEAVGLVHHMVNSVNYTTFADPKRSLSGLFDQITSLGIALLDPDDGETVMEPTLLATMIRSLTDSAIAIGQLQPVDWTKLLMM